MQLKVDTGLSRGGASRARLARRCSPGARARAAAAGSTSPGIWSHLAASDEPDHPANDAQEDAFREALALAATLPGVRPRLRHLANSAAAVLRPSSRFDLVRCGIATYGLDPAPGVTHDLGLRPAMTVRARLVMSKEVAAGDGVSYGHTWVAERDTTVGLVPAGYGEGIPRAAGNTAAAWVDGVRGAPSAAGCAWTSSSSTSTASCRRPAPRWCSSAPATAASPTAQDWAEAVDTINYEIVTRVGGRLSRRHVDAT